MKRVHKILWLILVIIVIGVVAVATRTPHRAQTAEAAASPPAGQSSGQAAYTATTTP